MPGPSSRLSPARPESATLRLLVRFGANYISEFRVSRFEKCHVSRPSERSQETMLSSAAKFAAMPALLRRHHTAAIHDNYYKLLGVTESFCIDYDQLAQRFKTLQRRWHPDKFVSRPPPDRQDAEDMSAKLNEAYSVLRAPYKRAKHLLNIRAQHTHPDLRHIEDIQLEPEFLLWVVDIRQSIADAAGDEANLANVKQSVGNALRDCLDRLTKAFDNNHLEHAAKETARLQYLRRIEQAILDFS